MFIWIVVMAIVSEEGINYYGVVGFDIDRLDNGGAGEWFAQLAKRSLDLNIMIFALNLLLPAYPMDAASMVAALCGHFGLSILRSAWVLVIIGAVLGFAALIIGILYIVAGSGPGVFLLLLGLYTMYTSWQMYGQIKAGNIQSHPIFKPDCYHRGQTTNLSQSPPVQRQVPPMSPTRSGRSRAPSPTKSAPRSPKSNGQSLPRRGGNRDEDIEMGKRSSPKKKNPSKKKPSAAAGTSETRPSTKKSPSKKKKAPSKKPPPT